MSKHGNEIADRTTAAGSAGPGRAVILFDGVCDLCHSGVAWIRARDQAGVFEFVPFQAPEVARRWPGLAPAALAGALHLVEPDGAVRVGADALPGILARLPGWGVAARLLALPGVRAVARPAYAFVARRRGLVCLTRVRVGD